MKKMIAIALFVIINSVNSFANLQPKYSEIKIKKDTIQSVQNGSWKNTSTWNRNRKPMAGDTVILKHEVTLDTVGNCYKIKYKLPAAAIAPTH